MIPSALQPEDKNNLFILKFVFQENVHFLLEMSDRKQNGNQIKSIFLEFISFISDIYSVSMYNSENDPNGFLIKFSNKYICNIELNLMHRNGRFQEELIEITRVNSMHMLCLPHSSMVNHKQEMSQNCVNFWLTFTKSNFVVKVIQNVNYRPVNENVLRLVGSIHQYISKFNIRF